MGLDTKPHKYRSQSGKAILEKVIPYIATRVDGYPGRLYLQQGQVYAGQNSGALKVREVPQQLISYLILVREKNPKQLEAIGWTKRLARLVDMSDTGETSNLGLSVTENTPVLDETLPEVPPEPENAEKNTFSELKRPQLMKACKEVGIKVNIRDTREQLLAKLGVTV